MDGWRWVGVVWGLCGGCVRVRRRSGQSFSLIFTDGERPLTASQNSPSRYGDPHRRPTSILTSKLLLIVGRRVTRKRAFRHFEGRHISTEHWLARKRANGVWVVSDQRFDQEKRGEKEHRRGSETNRGYCRSVGNDERQPGTREMRERYPRQWRIQSNERIFFALTG